MIIGANIERTETIRRGANELLGVDLKYIKHAMVKLFLVIG